jgi:PAS domain S-box-containing protein
VGPALLELFGKVVGSEKEETLPLFLAPFDRWVSVTAFLPEEGQIAAVFSDVTDQKKTELELLASEERLRVLFEFAPDAYYLSDLKGTLLSGNRAAEQLMGYTREELIGKSFLKLDLLPARAIPRATKLLALNALGHPTGPDEFILKRKDGSTVAVEIRTYPLAIQGEKMVLGLARDISKRRESEAAIRKSEEDLRSLIEQATYGIFRLDTSGVFLRANPALAEILGYSSSEELIGVRLDEGFLPPAKGAKEFLVSLGRGNRVDGIRAQWIRKDGTEVVLRLSGRPVRDENGEIESFELIGEDVTEHLELQEQLKQAQKMEEIGQLTGGIAHDFNNLLSVILLHTEILSDKVGDEDPILGAAVTGIGEAAERASSMTKKLLGFSRQAALQKVPTDLRFVVREILPMLSRVLPENIEIVLPEMKDPGMVNADPGAIEQILINLATNARDAMPDGGVLEVNVQRDDFEEGFWQLHPWAKPGDYVGISVRDTGLGMDDEARRRIFEPFFTTKSARRGTGLGMSMVHGLTKQHDGFVNVESEMGSGTTVSVHLPLLARTDEQEAPPARKQEKSSGDETILFVEDEEMLRRVGAGVLEKHGYRVHCAANGREALEIFSQSGEEIDLIITDLVMPKMGGAELLETLRASGECPKVMIISGYAGKYTERLSDLDPPVPLLQKPWKMADLLGQVRKVLDGEG